MSKQTKIMAILLVLAFLGPASARVITVEVEGVVNSIGTQGGFALDGSVSLGSAMTGYCTYDTDTPDVNPTDPDQGGYPLISISMTIGNYTFTHDLSSSDVPYFVVITIDDGYLVKSDAPRFDGSVIVSGTPRGYDDISWYRGELELFDLWTSSSEYIPTDALPDLGSWPDLGVFDMRREFQVTFTETGEVGSRGYFGIYGGITSLTVILEPAKTYYVDATDGSDDNDGLTPETAFATIQKAINSAFNGDMVIVADGTYTGPGNRDIDFLGKAITVRSESGPNNCTIDCENSGRGFYFHSNEDLNSIVEGFTIINGYTWLDWPGSYGGGIYCFRSSPTITHCIINNNTAAKDWSRGGGGGIFCGEGSPNITNCIISGNSANKEGGGIYCFESNATIINCIINNNRTNRQDGEGSGGGIACGELGDPILINCNIKNNSSNLGGGIYSVQYSSPYITNCTITGNSADSGGGICCRGTSLLTIANSTVNSNSSRYEGGGIYCGYNSTPTIINCTITGNTSGKGGGIACRTRSLTVVNNCTFTGNSALNGSTLACDSWRQLDPSNLQISNCIFWDGGKEIWNNDNSTITITYSDVQGGYEGEGNIDTDPLFVEPGYWDVNDLWVEGDYHLLPDSPCIDAGDPNYIAEPNETDLDGNPRVRGDAIDMGAYETIIHEARLLILPRVLNRKSGKPRVMAWVRLPQGITKDQIDADTPLILYPGGIKAMHQFVIPHRRQDAQRVSIFAFFDKAELMDAIPASGRVELQVLGYLRQPGQYYYGSDTIRIIPRPSKPQPRRLHKLF